MTGVNSMRASVNSAEMIGRELSLVRRDALCEQVLSVVAEVLGAAK
jgi:hypothetical protein